MCPCPFCQEKRLLEIIAENESWPRSLKEVKTHQYLGTPDHRVAVAQLLENTCHHVMMSTEKLTRTVFRRLSEICYS